MDLLTIACDRDFYLMDTQAKSIQRFVAPCTHWIFVNQTKKDRQEWVNLLSPYYINHTLNLVFSDDIDSFDMIDGYNAQQYLKLTAVDIIKNDHVIIDSKNIFVRDTDLATWTHEGTGVYGYYPEGYTRSDDPIDNAVLAARNYYSDYYKFPKIQKFFTICTPFVARKQIMEEVSNLIKSDNVFAKGTDLGWHADFMIYSMVGEKYGILDKEFPRQPGDINIKTLFYHGIVWNNDCSDGINRVKQNTAYSCISLHRTWIDNSTQELREEMVNFLEELGILQNKLKVVLEKGDTCET